MNIRFLFFLLLFSGFAQAMESPKKPPGTGCRTPVCLQKPVGKYSRPTLNSARPSASLPADKVESIDELVLKESGERSLIVTAVEKQWVNDKAFFDRVADDIYWEAQIKQDKENRKGFDDLHQVQVRQAANRDRQWKEWKTEDRERQDLVLKHNLQQDLQNYGFESSDRPLLQGIECGPDGKILYSFEPKAVMQEALHAAICAAYGRSMKRLADAWRSVNAAHEDLIKGLQAYTETLQAERAKNQESYTRFVAEVQQKRQGQDSVLKIWTEVNQEEMPPQMECNQRLQGCGRTGYLSSYKNPQHDAQEERLESDLQQVESFTQEGSTLHGTFRTGLEPFRVYEDTLAKAQKQDGVPDQKLLNAIPGMVSAANELLTWWNECDKRLPQVESY